MTHRNKIIAGAMALSLLTPVLCSAKTIEEVEKELEAAINKSKSYSATVLSSTEMDQGGMKMSMRMTGTYAVLKDGDKMKFRMEGKTKMEMPGMENAPGAGEQKLLVISDGEYTYQLSETMGMKNAVKSKAESEVIPWAAMRDTHELKVLPDEKVDGEDCFVIEAKAKEAAEMQANRLVFYCRKDIGATIKQVAFTAGDVPVNTLTFTDIKINPTFDPGHFKFEAPEGVTVVDHTGT